MIAFDALLWLAAGVLLGALGTWLVVRRVARADVARGPARWRCASNWRATRPRRR